MPFAPGSSGNPRGRPKLGLSLAEYIRKVGGKDGRAYVDVLHRIATAKPGRYETSDQIRAATELLNRGWGRPIETADLGDGPEPVRVTHVLVTTTTRRD